MPPRFHRSVCVLLVGIAAALTSAAYASTSGGEDMHQAMATYQMLVAGNMLVGIGASVAAIWSALTASRAGREVQRREISIAQQYQTREQAEAVQAAVDRRMGTTESELHGLRSEIRENRDEASRSSEDRITRVHSRLDTLEHRIADMPAQIVALLRNTKSI
jgi:gas vesicle protein